jgi:hypothetical protein
LKDDWDLREAITIKRVKREYLGRPGWCYDLPNIYKYSGYDVYASRGRLSRIKFLVVLRLLARSTCHPTVIGGDLCFKSFDGTIRFNALLLAHKFVL